MKISYVLDGASTHISTTFRNSYFTFISASMRPTFVFVALDSLFNSCKIGRNSSEKAGLNKLNTRQNSNHLKCN